MKFVTFHLLNYGRYVDLGVGCGTKAADRGGITKRKPKEWFYRQINREISVLRSLAENYYIRRTIEEATLPFEILEKSLSRHQTLI